FVFAPPAAAQADFICSGQLRWRWRLLPNYLWQRTPLIHWQGIANRSADRYAVILYQYRTPEDLAWLGRLARSLAEPRPLPSLRCPPRTAAASSEVSPQPQGRWQRLTNTLFGDEAPLDRQRSFAAIPMPAAGVASEEAPDQQGRVIYVPRPPFFRGWLGQRLAGGAAPARFFLDRLGNAVWSAIDGRRTVAEICEDFRARFGLHPREAEGMVVAFINSLLRRGVLTLHLAAEESEKAKG
ncbi:MAG: PqqD family protein, partial [Planctomycetota bacterium]|nr:PqqD family protein [Planctomycetota bacterium]